MRNEEVSEQELQEHFLDFSPEQLKLVVSRMVKSVSREKTEGIQDEFWNVGKPLVSWSIDWLIYLLIDRMIGWLIVRLIDWLIGIFRLKKIFFSFLVELYLFSFPEETSGENRWAA